MPITITTVRARDALKPRREPYWHRLAGGAYIGYRKMSADSAGAWSARYRDPETGQQRYRALGTFDEMPAAQRFDAAKTAAGVWFSHLGHGGSTDVVTVRAACEAYVTHLRETKGTKPADEADARFRRWVFTDTALAGTELGKLTRSRIEAWRKNLTNTPVKVNRDNRETPVLRPRAPGSLNREVTGLRAALNYAHDLGHVVTDMAWRVALRPTKNADRRRDCYLDRDQRRRLLDAAPPVAAAFLRGLCLLPLRPGALAGLTVADFDKRLGTLRIGKDKAGADRRITLPATTAAFFAEQAKGKLPAAPLFARADGMAWDKDAWKLSVKVAVKAAKLPAATTAYALRHSTITDLVTGGLPLLTVAQLSGTSVVMVERHYGHLQAAQAAAALAGLAL